MKIPSWQKIEEQKKKDDDAMKSAKPLFIERDKKIEEIEKLQKELNKLEKDIAKILPARFRDSEKTAPKSTTGKKLTRLGKLEALLAEHPEGLTTTEIEEKSDIKNASNLYSSIKKAPKLAAVFPQDDSGKIRFVPKE